MIRKLSKQLSPTLWNRFTMSFLNDPIYTLSMTLLPLLAVVLLVATTFFPKWCVEVVALMLGWS